MLEDDHIPMCHGINDLKLQLAGCLGICKHGVAMATMASKMHPKATSEVTMASMAHNSTEVMPTCS